MRNAFVIVIVALYLMGMPGKTAAQDVTDPAKWSYEVKKKSGRVYELIFHLELKEKWHIWSTKPGGDGFEIAPTFTFEPNAMVRYMDSVTENGKKTVTKMEGIEGEVTYLSGKIDYVQEVMVKGDTKVTGTHQFQICNDRMCLPPKDLHFEFLIKGAEK